MTAHALHLFSVDELSMKNIDDHFADWEGEAFGFGYGTGEEHVLGAIKTFFECLENRRSYDYRVLEAALTPATAWLLINVLAKVDTIEYGTSPRFGWLTRKGEALRDYFERRTLEQVVEHANRDHEYVHCYRDYCNCSDGDCRPSNPFWSGHI
jgi:hypothetical protein